MEGALCVHELVPLTVLIGSPGYYDGVIFHRCELLEQQPGMGPVLIARGLQSCPRLLGTDGR